MTTKFTGFSDLRTDPEFYFEYAHDVAAAIRTHHELSSCAKADLLEIIAEFDELELAGLFGATSTGNWLSRELHYPPSTAYEYVTVGTALRRFPLLAQAFRDAKVVYTTVRLLLRYITEENEADLVELAKKLCFSELKRVLAGMEENDEHKSDPDEPHLTLKDRPDGWVEGKFLLPPVSGAMFRAALKIAELAAHGGTAPDPAQLQSLLNDLTEADDCESYSEDDYIFNESADYSALSDMELESDELDNWTDLEISFDDTDDEEINPGVMVKPPRKNTKITAEEIARVPSHFGPPQKENLYPAFITMMNIVRAQPVTTTRAPGADVTVIVTEDGKAWMPQNPQVPSEALVGYVHNGLVRGHLLSSSGVTLHYGRKRRNASDAQVKALLELWGNQCATPGCTHSRFIEIHHIHEWAQGGLTDIENLVPLCSSCHSLVSHGINRITGIGTNLQFVFPNGAKYVSRNHSLPETA